MSDITEEEYRLILKFILDRERRRYELNMKPFVNEAVELEGRRPPRPVVGTDGKTYVYIGPTATQIGGEYKPPRWLKDIIEEDAELSHELRLHRNSRRPIERKE